MSDLVRPPSAELLARRLHARAPPTDAQRRWIASRTYLPDVEEDEPVLPLPTPWVSKRKEPPAAAASSPSPPPVSALAELDRFLQLRETDTFSDFEFEGIHHFDATDEKEETDRVLSRSFDEYYYGSAAEPPPQQEEEGPQAKRAKNTCAQCHTSGLTRYSRCPRSDRCKQLMCRTGECMAQHVNECNIKPQWTCDECGEGFRTGHRGQCRLASHCKTKRKVCKSPACVSKHDRTHHPTRGEKKADRSSPAIQKKPGACCVCEEPAEALVACDHVSMCLACAKKIALCPICRVPYSRVRSIFQLRLDC